MKKKRNSIKRNIPMFITNSLLCIASIVMSIILTKNIIELDVLPDKLFIMYMVGICLINIINIVLIIPKKIVFNIISIILSIALIVGSGIAVHHINNIDTFLKNAFGNNEYELTNYSVAVLKDSKYNTLEDLAGKKVGCVTLDSKKDDYNRVLSNVELKEYENSYVMYDALLAKKIDAIIIDDIYLEFLDDEYKDIYKKIKVIHEFEIKEIISGNSKENKIELQPINILISGSDSRITTKIMSKTRSDVNMIMTINPNTHEILLTSIPRDAYVQLHGTTGVKDKLTHAGIYGINMTKTTIEDFMNIKIDYTIKVGFGSVIKVVDLIGGIDIEADQDVYTRCGDGGAERVQVKKGWNHFTGPQALSYARERKGYVTGDFHRVQNQQQVIEAIVTKIASDKSLLSNYEEILNSLSELYRTDIPSVLIKKIVKNQLNDMKSWKVERQYVKGEGKMGVETYSMPGWKLWVMIPYESSLKNCSKNINDMKDGKNLSDLKL